MNISSKRLLHNLNASLIYRVLLVLQHFFLIPLFIKFWGVEEYGNWLVISAIPALISASDFGIGSAFSNQFVIKYSNGELQFASDLMKTGWVFLSSANTLLICAAVTLFVFSNVNFGLTSVYGELEFKVIVMFLTISRIIEFYQGLIRGYYYAVKKAHYVLYFKTCLLAIKIGVIAIVLCVNGGPLSLVISEFLVVAVSFLCLWWGCRSLNIKLPEGHFINDKKILLPMIVKSVSYMLNPMIYAINRQGMIMLTKIYCGAEAVVLVTTLRTLCNTVSQIFVIADSSIFPEMQHLISTGNLKSARNLYSKGIVVSFVVAAVVVLFLAFLGLPLYSYWTKGALSPTFLLWILFLLSTLISVVSLTAAIVFGATNRPELMSYMGILLASFSVVLMWIGYAVLDLGAYSVAIGWLCLEVLLCFYVLPVSSMLLGMHFSKLPVELCYALKELIVDGLLLGRRFGVKIVGEKI